MKLHGYIRCDGSGASVYRQRRDVGVGCLVGVVADRAPHGSSRDYAFVLGSGEPYCCSVSPPPTWEEWKILLRVLLEMLALWAPGAAGAA